MTGPLIGALDLAALLAYGPVPHVLDASYELRKPEFDGDYRCQPAPQRWLAAHIPGSRYVDVSSQFSDRTSPLHYMHPSPQAIADELAKLGIAEGDPVVVYDVEGGLWAARLWYLLDWIGVPVRVLDGGLPAWQAAGLQAASGEGSAARPVSPWVARAVRAAWITKEELLARSAYDKRPLVCGLSQGLFEGTETTRYVRRGRIPGSVSLPARGLYGLDGLLLPEPQLRAAHEAAGIDLHGSPVLLYSGGGISASANALALARLGLRDVAIYDGSLEEWAVIRSCRWRPARPLGSRPKRAITAT